MQLLELLPREHILAPLHAATVAQAINALLDRLVDAGAVREPDGLAPLRETTTLQGAVAVDGDVALPHFRTEAVDSLRLALGVSARPLEPGATGLTSHPRVVAVLLAPIGTAPLYLQSISTIVRFFGDAARRERILRARSPEDVIRVVLEADLRIQPRLAVRDLIAAAPPALAPDTTLADAAARILESGESALPVVGEEGEVLGTVSERDTIQALFPQMPRAGSAAEQSPEQALHAVRVRDVMTRSVLCVSEDMGLEEVATLIINKDVAQLPVVREGRLTGVLRRKDIIAKLIGR